MMVKTKERTTVTSKTSVVDEISKVSFILILTFGVFVGIVSLLGLVVGTIKVGGIVPLLSTMFSVL
ncbi:MAG: hypothetical protein KAS32_27680 [Candidatus Peribacteraceae bacterium]|nr:hypothetical protein [Candidatus Peribacteraceae bacterium]